MDLIKEAREIVRCQPMDLRVAHLRTCADELHEAYDILKVSCTREAATAFTAAVSRTLLAIERVHDFSPTSPSAGRMKADSKREIIEATGC